MKTKIIILFMYISGILLYAQDFSTKFYLTNKHGAKDSLELGYSSTATFGLDPQYGEVGYSIPVNSNKFGASIIINGSNEMLSQLIHNNEINSFSKKQIVPFQQTVWIEQNAIGIMIPVDSMPITISWDKSRFDDTQRNYSLITDWTLGGWFDAGGASFLKNLKDTNSIQVKDRIANYFFSDGTNQYPMYIFYIAFGNSSNIKTDIKSVSKSQLTDFAIIKNGFIEIKQDLNISIKQVSIYNTLGELVFQKSSNQISQINISNYKKGMYILNLATVKGQFNYKIINK